jgi:hypothetical protein
MRRTHQYDHSASLRGIKTIRGKFREVSTADVAFENSCLQPLPMCRLSAVLTGTHATNTSQLESFEQS